MSRWIVRDAVRSLDCGNGIWTRHWTKAGARRSLARILTFRHGSGFYAIPAGGLVVVRAGEAFSGGPPPGVIRGAAS